MARRHGLQERVRRRLVLRKLQPEREAVQRPDPAELRHDRNVARQDAVLESSVLERLVRRCMHTRGEAVLEQRDPDLQ
jgi:hypothetical protein